MNGDSWGLFSLGLLFSTAEFFFVHFFYIFSILVILCHKFLFFALFYATSYAFLRRGVEMKAVKKQN